MANTYGDIINFLDREELKHLNVYLNIHGNLETITSVNKMIFFTDPRFKKIHTVEDLIDSIKFLDENSFAAFYCDRIYNRPIITHTISIIEKTSLIRGSFINESKYIEIGLE